MISVALLLSIQAFDWLYICLKQLVRLIKDMRLTVESGTFVGPDFLGKFGRGQKLGEMEKILVIYSEPPLINA